MGDRQETLSKNEIKHILARYMQLRALDIKVETQGGTVLLSGVVDVLAEKLYAEEVVRHLDGVQKVENKLTVAQGDTVNDAELKKAIDAAIQKEERLEDVVVKVQKGIVHLQGKALTLADEDLARNLAARVKGVVDVTSSLDVATGHPIEDSAITQMAADALFAAGQVNKYAVSIQTKRGVVYLTGWVETAAMKEEATGIISGVEGVRRVLNNLLVEEEQSEGDVYLTNIIRQVITQGLNLSLKDIRVFVLNGWVYLGGQVDTIDQREALEDVIRQIDGSLGGVEGITNDIVVIMH
ncbi:MAG: BON domain-containing protein [Firmicutes bacterium]|nr:BON domain-containing protein [Bacillota bacterium]